MLKKILQHNISQKFFGLLIAYYLKICFHTSSWNVKNEKATLIMVTHDNNLANQTMKKIKIKDGRID